MNSTPGCQSYDALCNVANTAVQQCSIAGVPNLVSTATAINDVNTLCNEMPGMVGCSMCTGSSLSSCADPLLALSTVCLNMYMSDCGHWNNMCSGEANGFVPFCGGSAASPSATGAAAPSAAPQCRGTMIMYFHGGYQGEHADLAAGTEMITKGSSMARLSHGGYRDDHGGY